MTKLSHKQESIQEVAKLILAKGYRVFIANSGTYGFYTDKEGTKVISFGIDYLSVSVSGNYKSSNPQQTGRGWRIADYFNENDIDAYFKALAPRWAVGSNSYKFTTLADQLKTYGASSGYVELK